MDGSRGSGGPGGLGQVVLWVSVVSGPRWSCILAKPHPHLFDDVGEAPLREVVHPLHPEADDSAPRPLDENVGEAPVREVVHLEADDPAPRPLEWLRRWWWSG